MVSSFARWEKREVWLDEFECDCGHENTDPKRFSIESDSSVSCESCGREYDVIFPVRLMEVDGPSPSFDTESLHDGGEYLLTYESAISGNEKILKVTPGDGLLVDEEERAYQVGGEDRDDNELLRDGRKIGTYVSLDST